MLLNSVYEGKIDFNVLIVSKLSINSKRTNRSNIPHLSGAFYYYKKYFI